MADDVTLGEYLAQAQRSMGGGYFGRMSGPMSGYLFGPDFFRKQTYLQIADTFVATYGKKVWDALNNKTVSFNAIKKVDWGPTVGWRWRTDRGTGRSRPVTETGALPVMDVSNYVGVYSYPKNIASVFGVSLKGQAVSALEGGIGNQFAVEQEAASRDHIKEINQEFMAGSAYLCSGGSTTTFVIGGTAAAHALAKHMKIGDTVAFYDTSVTAYNEAQGGVVSAVDITNGTITVSTLGTAAADGDIVYIRARNGMTSLDDICAEDDMTVGGQKAAVDIYNQTTRTAGGYAAGAYVSYNSGVGRDLTLAMVDTCFEKIREAGGEPKLIVTGLDQYDNLNQLLQVQQRFVDVTDYIVGVGDERTYPGTRAGFQLATYRGVPILPDPDTPKSLSTTDTVLGSNLYVLDTDYLEVAVMYPTQYLENRDYFAIKDCGEEKPNYMLENPVDLVAPFMVTVYPVGTISREDSCLKESPQRLYVGHSVKNEDIVRTEQRCSEVGRNDQLVLICLNCGKILERNQKKFCSKFCQGKYQCNFSKDKKVWNKNKTKDEFPQLSNSGVKVGNIPWNKGKKGLQTAWNINLTKEIDERIAKYGKSHKGHPCYKGSGNSKSGFREDLGHFVRSTWEANGCRILLYLGIPYKYEYRRFDLGEYTYCPDISIYPDTSQEFLWEIKGYENSEWQRKLELFKKLHSEWKIEIINKKKYFELTRIFSTKIANWEGNRIGKCIGN